MESNGEKGKINVSEETKKLLESDEKGEKLTYVPHKTVSIKKNNITKEVKCFLINERRD